MLRDSFLSRVSKRRRARNHPERVQRGSGVRVLHLLRPGAVERVEVSSHGVQDGTLRSGLHGVVLVEIRVEESGAGASRVRVVESPNVSVVHLVESRVVLVPVAPSLHHGGEGVKLAGVLVLRRDRLADGALTLLEAASALGGERLLGLGARLATCRLVELGGELGGVRGVSGPPPAHRPDADVAKQQTLDRVRVVALNLHCIVRHRASPAPQRLFQHLDELPLVPADVRY